MPIVSRKERANAIRFLSIDAVQKAHSGHPGMPMGMADIAEVLWYDFLKHNPKNPNWHNRDRFILSNGHGAMLQYALLHLTGYDLSLDEIKNFRQLHSKTPGHPEFGLTPGIEVTTGPLGQGFANAVGMAIAEAHLAATFNKPDYPIIDHDIYCFIGDGDLMEGISHEAASLAGTLGLGRLIVFYDDNGISIDGDVSGWFNDNTPLRFQAYGWHVIPNVNGHNSDEIKKAILEAKSKMDQPTLICCNTTIGWGSPNLSGKAVVHGAPLGVEEVKAVRTQLNWPFDEFVIPNEIYKDWNAIENGVKREEEWNALFADYARHYPLLANELKRRFANTLPENWETVCLKLAQKLNEEKKTMATRKASQICLDNYTKILPELFGGSADLTESNCTNWKEMKIFSKNQREGSYLHYGVREFGMSAIMNGIARYQGVIPFGGTFLTFSDYARNAIRLASLMKQRVIYVYTHDSIGLGEDGPTHQPIEHITSLRLIPELSLWRPCDTVETAVAWAEAISRNGPTCLLFSRQNLPCQNHDAIQNIKKGGYILRDGGQPPHAIIIATGSEIALAIEAAELLEREDIFIRVVSMPSTDVFLKQTKAYQDEVLPPYIKARVVVEAGASLFWLHWVHDRSAIIGLDQFGASAPAQDVFTEFGFTVANVVTKTKESILDFASLDSIDLSKRVSGVSS